jgi:hypothetical protein
MTPDEWRMIDTSSDQQFVDALRTVWSDVVLAAFAARYSLIPSRLSQRCSVSRSTLAAGTSVLSC